MKDKKKLQDILAAIEAIETYSVSNCPPGLEGAWRRRVSAMG
jgi:hypothetical protein